MRTTRDALDRIRSHRAVAALADALDADRRAVAVGAAGSSPALLAAALAQRCGRPALLVVGHLDDADDVADAVASFAGPDAALRFPALELLPGESHVSLELFAERTAVVRRIVDGALAGPVVLVAPIQALMQAVPAPERLASLSLVLRKGDAPGQAAVVRWLDQAGYERADAAEEPGQFAVRGGILDVFPPGAAATEATSGVATGGAPVRLDFFGDTLDALHEFDLDTMGSGRALERIELVGASLQAVQSDEGTTSLLDLLPNDAFVLVHETLEVVEQGRGYFERVADARGVFGPPAVLKALQSRFRGFAEINQFSTGLATAQDRFDLPARPLPEFPQEIGAAIRDLLALGRTRDTLVLCRKDAERARLAELLDDAHRLADPPLPRDRDPHAAVADLHRGFLWGDDDADGAALVPYHEILHRYDARRRVRRLRGGRATDAFLDLQPGDFVVHEDHGVARFLGLTSMKPRPPKREGETEAEHEARRDAQAPEEYLTLEFAQGARLHVPSSKIEAVQKYIGGFQGKPPLSTLGGKKWKTQKERTGAAVRDLAAEMLRVQAARAAMPGVRFPPDTPWQSEFEAEFPYDETEDQLAALVEIRKDMQSSRPMDRLICGDVGYGKTELAIRAAFKSAEFGKQVAVLVPTTVLAEQHERTFRARFADYPFRVASLSRFKTHAEQNRVLAELRKGQVDIVIGTHRLLSKDVKFADLGLVIVDEEQRFGVEHKQALLALRMTVDVLTLSATPIPRTLHMAMLGLRDISSLTTAPMDRRAVVTEVLPYNEKRIASALARELAREGQAFFVHNRVHNIREVADDVARLAPGARVIVGHGQMEPHELEDVMLRFIRRDADILVSTTIIESGIDIPNANTIIINDADRFGLADLHQLRGRVGRYKHRAYCYLLLPKDRPVTDVAQKRLRAIEEFSMLGAGFKIAMRDLEIRGAGNLLGPEQSGHIAAVGYDMYCRLLDRAVRELKHEPVAEPHETTIDIGLTGSLPKAWIPSDMRRMEAYRRIARAASPDELRAVEKDLTDAYGTPPKLARRLLDLAELRALAAALGVRSLSVHEKDVILRCPDTAPVAAALAGARGTVRALPPAPNAPDAMPEVYYRPPENYLDKPESLLAVLRKKLAPAPPHDAPLHARPAPPAAPPATARNRP